jgi:hypothetical protein
MYRTLLTGIAMALYLGLISSPAAIAADVSPKKRSVVIQVSEDDSKIWNHALNIANALQDNLGKENVDVEIVAMSPGIKMLAYDTSVNNRLTAAKQNGIQLVACGYTMEKLKMNPGDLISGVKVVKGGVIEIMDKQDMGWHYIKP